MDYLGYLFSQLRDKKKVALLSLLFLFIGLRFADYLRSLFFVLVFILLGGLSKIYHRFFRSAIGVDLVLFFSLITAKTYNPVLALVVALPGLVLAEIIGTKFSVASVGTLISLISVMLVSPLLANFGIISSLLVLTLLFEIIISFFYLFILGSSPAKLALFLVSHLLWNLFLIFTTAIPLQGLMI